MILNSLVLLWLTCFRPSILFCAHLLAQPIIKRKSPEKILRYCKNIISLPGSKTLGGFFFDENKFKRQVRK